MQIKSNEIKIGIMVIACLIGFIFITLRVGTFSFYQPGYHFFVEMKDISGLEKHAPVKLNGVDIGKVDTITIKYDQADTILVLDIWAKAGVRISPEAVVSVRTLGLMGEKYVAIQQASATKAIQPNTVLRGYGVSDMDDLLKQGKIISDQISVLLTDVRSLTNDLRSVAGNFDGILLDNRQNVHNVVLYLEGITKNFDELSLDLKRNPWKLLYRSNK